MFSLFECQLWIKVSAFIKSKYYLNKFVFNNKIVNWQLKHGPFLQTIISAFPNNVLVSQFCGKSKQYSLNYDILE